MKNLSPEVIKSLREKLGLGEQTIRNGVTRLGKKYPQTTPNARAQIIAMGKRSTVWQKLDKEDKASMPVVDIVNEKIKISARTQKSSTTVIRTKFGEIKEPFLSKTINREALLMAEQSYLTLYILENSVRNFINTIMSTKYGTDWWKNRMNTKELSKISFKVQDRMKKEEINSWHGKRGSHQVYYSDFSDLSSIIESERMTFRPFFKNLKFKEDWLLHKLSEIEPSRNVTAHHNPLDEKDLNRVHGNLMDWISQLEYMKSNGIL